MLHCYIGYKLSVFSEPRGALSRKMLRADSRQVCLALTNSSTKRKSWMTKRGLSYEINAIKRNIIKTLDNNPYDALRARSIEPLIPSLDTLKRPQTSIPIEDQDRIWLSFSICVHTRDTRRIDVLAVNPASAGVLTPFIGSCFSPFAASLSCL